MSARPHDCTGPDDCGVCLFDVLHLPGQVGSIVAHRRGAPTWPEAMQFLAQHWRERGSASYAARIEAELSLSVQTDPAALVTA